MRSTSKDRPERELIGYDEKRYAHLLNRKYTKLLLSIFAGIFIGVVASLLMTLMGQHINY